MPKEFQFEPNTIYTRSSLAYQMGTTDRRMRQNIRDQRRAGIPIMALKSGGYKLAETDAEKRELLRQYRERAMDELVTYGRLVKSMQVDGQLSIGQIAAFADYNSEVMEHAD